MKQSGEVTRRRFLGGGVGAASAMLLGPAVRRAAADGQTPAEAGSTQPAGGGDDIRCGMIGVGGRGGGVLEAIHKSPGVRVTALCDVHAGRLNEAARKVEGDKPRLFGHYREMLDFKELDAVFVETPVYLHAEMVLAVLESGRHCYGEKPMAIKVADLNKIVETVKRTKKVYQVGTQLRYGSPWRPTIEAICKGVVGKPIFIRAHRHNVGDLPHDRAWYFKRELCGDTICEQAVHEFDIFNAVFQGLPERASGFGGQALLFDPPGRDIMDHYTLSLDYGKNRKMSYSHSWISAPGVFFDGRQEVVYGETGAVDIEHGTVFPKEAGKKQYKVDPEAKKGDLDELAVNDFFRCIREGAEPIANAEAGRGAALVALLGRKAIDEGRVVTMKELLAQG